MADYPSIPLFTDAYLADTRHLSTEEHGAYLLLMMEAWRRPTCSLPDDDALLCRLAGLSSQRWEEVKPIVMGFWTLDGRRKTWTQKRLSQERDFVARKSASQAEKASKRWNKTKNDDPAALPGECPADTPTPTPTPTQKEQPFGCSKRRKTMLPDGWNPNEKDFAFAASKNLTEQETQDEAEKFCNHHRAHGNTRADWSAAWRAWIANVRRFGPPEGRRPPPVDPDLFRDL
jgi:uncharacterized protein YdaU (DUF1376 family)